MTRCPPLLLSCILMAAGVVEVYCIQRWACSKARTPPQEWSPGHESDPHTPPTAHPSIPLHTQCKRMFHIIILIHHPYRLHRLSKAWPPSNALTELQEAHKPFFSLCHIVCHNATSHLQYVMALHVECSSICSGLGAVHC